MRTVFTTFPIFDSIEKQDYERTGQLRPLYTPRHKLPPFQFQADTTFDQVTGVFLNNCSGATLDITNYFDTLPSTYGLTNNNDYIQYKGDNLNTLLPFGSYYLEVTYNDTSPPTYQRKLYSEYFSVENIYPNLITGWTNFGYGTFSSTGTTINQATASAAGPRCYSNEFNVEYGETIKVIFKETLTSGTAPRIDLRRTNASIAVTGNSAAGANEISLVSTWSGTAIIWFYATAAVDFSTNEVIVIREYSDDFVKLKMSNTKDLPTPTNEASILYQDSWYDEMWFKTKLNTPEPETTREGTEKNGVFIAEKIVSIYRYKIIDYIGRNLFRALHRVPLHDDVQITDEVGNVYDVAHDIQVDPVSWDYYDMGTLTMRFNDGASVWEGNADNLT